MDTCPKISFPALRSTQRPAVLGSSAAKSGGGGRSVVPVCHTDVTFSGLRQSAHCHHKLLLRVIALCRKNRTGYKTLLHTGVVEMTNCERIKTTIRIGQLWFAGALVRQKKTCLPKYIMNGRLI
ncbi:unnamed protein product, partial [Sphacelaria rigidula]